MSYAECTCQENMMDDFEQLKSELLNTISHELRSPLSSIKGYTATLLRYDKRLRRDEQREFLEAIRDASDNLSVIVDRLLEMAEFEANAIQLHSSPVDMVHLAQEAIDSAGRSRHAMQVTAAHPRFFTFSMHVTDERGLPAATVPHVQGDQRRLREVLDNILENAMKFSPHSSEISMTLRPVTSSLPAPVRSQGGEIPALAELPMLEIKIQDHGVGIADEHLLRIFERFQRIDTRLIREVNGLGLGLAICKCIVALHNGYLWAESQPGEGSTFSIWLPLAPVAQTAQMQTTES
ncbi:MAG: HAMP domain-containing sensor histidine kinase [Ktedonobacteraceae bacterium]